MAAALLPACISSSSFRNVAPLSAPPKKLLSPQLASIFSGQKLRIQKSNIQRSVHAPYFLIRGQLNKNNSSFSHDLIESSEHFLDDLSHWISKKVAEIIRPHLPENFDVLDWIPSGLHSRIHSVERAATVLVRECLLLVIFYFLFARVGRFCQWLSRVHYSETHEDHKPTRANYRASAYSAMEDPLRAGLVLWELTRLLYMAGPLFKLKFSLLMVGKVRSVGFILLVTWFLFRWKGLVLERLISQNKADAPRLITFDKVLSLLMYYIAGTCIGEVSGFALQSVLAIGGVSGIAVGLAAKEIAGNFLGGTLLFITRPFVIGDEVKAESFEGWVEDIDFLHTKLIGHDRSPVLVPNQAIVKEVIINYSRAKCRQLLAVFKLRNEDIFLIDKITGEITEYLVNHPKVDLEYGTKPVCYLKAMGSHGLELELLCFLKEKESVAFYKEKQQILVKAAEIVTSAGASLETSVPSLLCPNQELSAAELA